MFCRRYLLGHLSICRKSFIKYALVSQNFVQYKNYSGCCKYIVFRQNDKGTGCIHPINYDTAIHRNCYSTNILDGDVTLKKSQQDIDFKKLSDIFPQPRVTLNEFQNRTLDKIFDVYYKQNLVSPKGTKKKAGSNSWICTYAFVWPEKIKFEGTALSKRQAAEKAAFQAINYLYINKRIDNRGHPIYNREVLEKLKREMQEPLCASVSETAVERVERIWESYKVDIMPVYDKTFAEAKGRIVTRSAILTKDSTIDNEDIDIPTNKPYLEASFDDFSEPKIQLHPVYGRNVKQPSEATVQRRNRELAQKFERYDEELVPLPIDNYADAITSTLESSRVAVLVGAAGCGKSTRAPAAILRKCLGDTAVIVSQPRRVAAIDLAERVAIELGESVGESIGYQVRLHTKPPRPPCGSILFCTSGVLLKRLQLNPGLTGCSHVFIDEAHERDVNTDVTMLLLKRALDLNPKLRVVVMSATLDIDVFTRYFNQCPIIEVPGRKFPVEVTHLDEIQRKFRIDLRHTMGNCNKVDSKPTVYSHELVDVIKAVDKSQTEGAILVFLPGWAEIKQTKKYLDEHFRENTHLILPIHSRLSTADQTKMFSVPPPGIRKIVLATNIAETSVTIPDVVYVVDTGASRENRLKEGTGTASLETVWVSLAGANQRTGRAGRIRPGYCYRLYTKEKESEFVQHTTPEILRIPLDQTVLDLKTYAPDDKIANFLSQLPEPPTAKAIQFAVNDLIDMGALTPTEQLTRLGAILSSLSLAPRLALTLLYSLTAGNTLSCANVVTHCANSVEVFSNAADRRDEIREIKRSFNAISDHSALHCIQVEFERRSQEFGKRAVDVWCDKYGLRGDRLRYVKSLSHLHLEQLLKSALIDCTTDAEDLNRFSAINELTAAILLSGSNSLLKTKKRVRTKGKLKTAVEVFTSTGDRAHIASESVNHGITKRNVNTLLAYNGGYHSTERRALVVYKTTTVSSVTALMFCMGDLKTEDDGDVTIMCLPRHQIEVHMNKREAECIKKAREMLWNTFQYYIERNLKTLDFDVNTAVSRFKVRLIKAICKILIEADKEKKDNQDYEADR